MRKTAFICCLLLAAQVQAGCAQEAGEIFIEHVSAPEIDVFCNKTQSTIILNRLFKSKGVQAGWSSELDPFGCSVFFTDTGPFIFACSKASASRWEAVDCRQYVLTSHLPWDGELLCGKMPTGSYWIAEKVFAEDLPLILRHQCFDV